MCALKFILFFFFVWSVNLNFSYFLIQTLDINLLLSLVSCSVLLYLNDCTVMYPCVKIWGTE